MKSNSLTLASLVVAREGAPLTAPITLALEGGQMLAIHGANGSGKSTLLKTLAGLVAPDSGTIAINGAWPAARRPFYLGHKRGLVPTMSVYDNVAFWARAAGYPELTAAAMHYFELTDIADTTVTTLSAGWQQRVALTRLITIPTALWLLDEPTANLDTEGTALLQSLMQSRLEQGGIVVVATHTRVGGDSIKILNLSELNKTLKVNA
ncbi:MAG: heme ABC exporter ATP-binding protein CcmA [Pseudomonadota bacterium]